MDYDYNTSRKQLIMPEYGRNIHKMVDHINKIEDRDERNWAARSIINVMGNMNPHLRDIEDFKHKLWDHLAIMSNFQLDIDYPYELPSKLKLSEKPRTVPYNNYSIRFKHYGKAVELFTEKALRLEKESERNQMIEMIANHMKKSYLTWNRENVTDQVIFNDLVAISRGRVTIPEDLKLSDAKEFVPKTQKKKKSLKKIK